MHRIDTPTAQADKFGQGKNGFTNGDPATGRRATDLNSDMWDAVQEEICTAIESAGLTLDKTKHDQLYRAIVKIITSKIPDALLRNNNLSDVVDKALARANLELGTAAIKNVQLNKDDTTAGRVLVNGGALALRSVSASGEGGAYAADCNDLPVNSVSFCYGSAAHSPGYEATILDVAGLRNDYRVQYAASYSDGGKRLKFRTRNGDNGQWGAAWTSVLTNYGGTVDYLDGARYYAIRSEYWQGNGGFAQQYTDGTAPFFVPLYSSPKDVSIYLPIVKGMSQTSGYGYGAAVSFGILRSGSNDFGSAVVNIIGDNGNAAVYSFDINGTFNAPGQLYSGGNIVASQGVYESGGAVRVYSSNNPPPQQDLSHLITDVGYGAQGSGVLPGGGTFIVPSGCTMTGWYTEGNTPGGDTIFYRQLMKYIPAMGWVGCGNIA
ncbi:hypothetical protein RVW18_000347 [Enterobacter bugandensis]|nr:hypothetical protein [Enterobacter bugandensis]